MSNLKRSYKTEFISLIVITLIFFFYRISKIKIINAQLQNNTVYINDFINLDLVWNTGIGFGILSTNTALFYNFITFLIFSVIIFLLYLILKSKFIDKILYSIVVGGALGNFYDRLVYFAVPDFIDFHFQSFHWFTFNIADIFITIGIITIIGKELIIKDEKN